MTSTEDARVRDRGVIKSGAIAIEPPPPGLGAPLEAGPPPRALAAARGPWAYRKAALLHPSNLIALAAVLMLGLVNPSGQIVLFGIGAELIYLFIAPRSRWIRRCLDEGYVEAAEAARLRAREALIAKMSDPHRDELKRLDGLIRRMREGAAEREDLAPIDHVDLGGLLASYIRLALAHRACEEALALTEQRSLRASIRALEASSMSAPERVRSAIRERLAVAQERVADEARVREDLEVISHQLAMIADLVYLRHQRAITRGPASEVERFIQDLDERRSAAREIAALDAGDRLAVKSIACALS